MGKGAVGVGWWLMTDEMKLLTSEGLMEVGWPGQGAVGISPWTDEMMLSIWEMVMGDGLGGEMGLPVGWRKDEIRLSISEGLGGAQPQGTAAEKAAREQTRRGEESLMVAVALWFLERAEAMT